MNRDHDERTRQLRRDVDALRTDDKPAEPIDEKRARTRRLGAAFLEGGAEFAALALAPDAPREFEALRARLSTDDRTVDDD